MKVIKIIIAIISNKQIRIIAKEAIDMIKKIIAEVKKAKDKSSKGGDKITKEERKEIVKVGLIEFEDVVEGVVNSL